MSYIYAPAERENDEHALPNVEVFYRTEAAIALDFLATDGDWWADGDGEMMGEGWYWWACFPGCMPDSDPCGPFDTEAEAIADAQEVG